MKAHFNAPVPHRTADFSLKENEHKKNEQKKFKGKPQVNRNVYPTASGSMVRKRRKFLCGVTTLAFPSLVPHSLTRRKPLSSSNGLSRSSTEAEQKLALSNSTHPPVSTARNRAPAGWRGGVCL